MLHNYAHGEKTFRGEVNSRFFCPARIAVLCSVYHRCAGSIVRRTCEEPVPVFRIARACCFDAPGSHSRCLFGEHCDPITLRRFA